MTIAMLLTVALTSHAQQTDPALAAAVAAQTVTLGTLFPVFLQ